jgi:3-methyladenine DNA glycosylase AlkD
MDIQDLSDDYILFLLKDELMKKSDPEYIKREITLNGVPQEGFLGVRKPFVREVAGKYWRNGVKKMPDPVIFNLCDSLVAQNSFELRAVAFDWAKRAKKLYRPEHFTNFEDWVNKNLFCWIDCDDLCTGFGGEFLLKYPKYLSSVLKWARSENRWVRRAAAVSLILPAKRGLYSDAVFCTADALLTDSDVMVQKGYGWMLKVLSASYPDDVYSYVLSNKDIMPRTSLRYAIEKLPCDMKKKAMEK